MSEPFVTFNVLYDAARKQGLLVGLDIETVPASENTREPYLPAADIYDPGKRQDHFPFRLTTHDVKAAQVGPKRTATYIAMVVDGSTFVCNGKLGTSIKSPTALRELQRMAEVLVRTGRVPASAFEPSDP